MQASSAISFRLPPASFSAAAWPGSPLLSSFRFLASLGFHFHGRLPFPLLFLTPAVFAPFRSLQFWVLTTQPSVLPFCSLHASASQLLPRCSFGPFVPQVFPLPSRLVSHPFSPALLTWPCCSFPFALPCFAPTAVPQVLASFPFAFAPVPLASFRSAPLPFVRFRLPVSATQLSRSSFPLLPSLALRRLVRCSVVSFVPTFSSSFHPGFPWLLSDSAYSVLCLVLFRPSRFISRS